DRRRQVAPEGRVVGGDFPERDFDSFGGVDPSLLRGARKRAATSAETDRPSELAGQEIDLRPGLRGSTDVVERSCFASFLEEIRACALLIARVTLIRVRSEARPSPRRYCSTSSHAGTARPGSRRSRAR